MRQRFGLPSFLLLTATASTTIATLPHLRLAFLSTVSSSFSSSSSSSSLTRRSCSAAAFVRPPSQHHQHNHHQPHSSSRAKPRRLFSTPTSSASSSSSSSTLPKKNAWGQRIVPLDNLPPPSPSSLPPSASPASFVVVDLTDTLLRRGLPEIGDIKEGVAFFHLQQQQQEEQQEAESKEGSSSSSNSVLVSPSLVVVLHDTTIDQHQQQHQHQQQNLVGIPIRDGHLVDPQNRPGTPHIHLLLPTAMDPSLPPSLPPSSTITVTWNGDKIRAGSSHRCAATRDDEVAPERKAALDAALVTLGIDLQALTEEEQVTGSGSSALRSYFSFVQPRPNKQHGPVDNAIDLAANRAANQIAFLVRAYRAEQAEFLRNHDEAMSLLQQRALPMHPLLLILDNIRSAYNVGSLFRTAETALVQEVITCGFTPHPPHDKLKKTACRSLENVPSRHFATTLEAVRKVKEEGYKVYAMETTSRSECYAHVAFPEKVALVLGNEVIGVDTVVLEECDGGIIEIPTFGQKNSLNVASAAPVVVFEVLRQWGVFGEKKEGNL